MVSADGTADLLGTWDFLWLPGCLKMPNPHRSENGQIDAFLVQCWYRVVCDIHRIK